MEDNIAICDIPQTVFTSEQEICLKKKKKSKVLPSRDSDWEFLVEPRNYISGSAPRYSDKAILQTSIWERWLFV